MQHDKTCLTAVAVISALYVQTL